MVLPKMKSLGVLLTSMVAAPVDVFVGEVFAGFSPDCGTLVFLGAVSPLHCFLLSGGIVTTVTGKAGTLCIKQIIKVKNKNYKV